LNFPPPYLNLAGLRLPWTAKSFDPLVFSGVDCPTTGVTVPKNLPHRFARLRFSHPLPWPTFFPPEKCGPAPSSSLLSHPPLFGKDKTNLAAIFFRASGALSPPKRFSIPCNAPIFLFLPPLHPLKDKSGAFFRWILVSPWSPTRVLVSPQPPPSCWHDPPPTTCADGPPEALTVLPPPHKEAPARRPGFFGQPAMGVDRPNTAEVFCLFMRLLFVFVWVGKDSRFVPFPFLLVLYLEKVPRKAHFASVFPFATTLHCFYLPPPV